MARAILLMLALVLAGAALSAQPSKPVVVVELFTSEGCSSCPPADQLLARLEETAGGRGKRRPLAPRGIEIIALGEHVDYWDDLGWQDRFSSPLFSARQQDYGIALHQSTVYTPQAVINGAREALGSDSRALIEAVREAAREPLGEASIETTDAGTFVLRVGKLPPGSHAADVLLAIAESGITTEVGAGENRGRSLTHAAVVHTMSRLGELDPARPGEYVAEARLNLQPDWKPERIKVVLLVQDRENRRILAAAAARLTPPARPARGPAPVP